jgi:hypothetical protein
MTASRDCRTEDAHGRGRTRPQVSLAIWGSRGRRFKFVSPTKHKFTIAPNQNQVHPALWAIEQPLTSETYHFASSRTFIRNLGAQSMSRT